MGRMLTIPQSAMLAAKLVALATGAGIFVELDDADRTRIEALRLAE
jgi:hypothetical protein